MDTDVIVKQQGNSPAAEWDLVTGVTGHTGVTGDTGVTGVMCNWCDWCNVVLGLQMELV